MSRHRSFVLFAIGAALVALSGCKSFPELEVSEAQFDRKTPYPKLIPLEVLLKEPEPAITDDVQTDLTTRRDDLLSTPAGADADAANDPVLNRIDALRARQEAQAKNHPIIDEELRKRMESGIKPPVATQ